MTTRWCYCLLVWSIASSSMQSQIQPNVPAKPKDVSVRPECRDEFVKYNDKCYYFGLLKVNFADAKKHCNALGAERVVVETYGEDMFITRNLVRLRPLYRQIYPKDAWWGIWMDAINTHKGSKTFIWSTTGQTVSYTRWKSGRPGDHPKELLGIVWHQHIAGQAGASSAYFEMEWYDLYVSGKYGIVCEMPTFT